MGKLAVLDFRVVHVLEVGGIKFLQNGTCLSVCKSTYPWRCDLVFIKYMFALDSISGWSLPNCKSAYSPYYKCKSICNVLDVVFPFWLTVTYLFAFSGTVLYKRCNSSSCISTVSIMKLSHYPSCITNFMLLCVKYITTIMVNFTVQQIHLKSHNFSCVVCHRSLKQCATYIDLYYTLRIFLYYLLK